MSILRIGNTSSNSRLAWMELRLICLRHWRENKVVRSYVSSRPLPYNCDFGPVFLRLCACVIANTILRCQSQPLCKIMLQIRWNCFRGSVTCLKSISSVAWDSDDCYGLVVGVFPAALITLWHQMQVNDQEERRGRCATLFDCLIYGQGKEAV